MGLQLNDPPEKYKVFYGKATEQMPKLLAEGRTPLSVSDIMYKRLFLRHDRTDIRTSWLENYFHTSDAIAAHPDEKFKLVLDAEPLRELNRQSRLHMGKLILPDGMYEKLEGPEYTFNEFLRETHAGKENIKRKSIWKRLARDQHLLEDYVDFVSSKGDPSSILNMSILFHLPEKEVATIAPLKIRENKGGSYVEPEPRIDSEHIRFIGMTK